MKIAERQKPPSQKHPVLLHVGVHVHVTFAPGAFNSGAFDSGAFVAGASDSGAFVAQPMKINEGLIIGEKRSFIRTLT